MKLITNTKVVSRIDPGRAVISLLLLLLLGVNLSPSAAQSRPQRRITSIWTATNAAGSRVTVTSDVSLGDYEAYKRGDRFYVKIPQADLPSARGSLLGRGFDDVQIQRYGDGICISFHLQPGTAAHVDQNPNRLEIVFALPGRSQYTDYTSPFDSSNAANRTRARRTQAAPTTTSVAQSFSRVPRYSSSESGARRKSSAGRGRTRDVAARDDSIRNRASGKTGTDKSNAGATSSASTSTPSSQTGGSKREASSSPSPSPSPVATATLANPQGVASSSLTNSGASASVTPAAQRPAPVPTPTVSAGTKKLDFWGWVHYYKVYTELNPVPVLLGALAAIVLLILFVLLLRRLRSTLRRRLIAGSVSQERARERARQADIPPVVVASRVTPQPQAESARSSVTTPLADAANSRSRVAAHAAGSAASSLPRPTVSEEEEREVFVL